MSNAIEAQGKLFLKSEGVRVIVDYLQKKGSLKCECVVCDNFEQFSSELEQILQNKPTQDLKKGLILRHAGGESSWNKDSCHFTTIYAERKNGELFCVILDSRASRDFYIGTIETIIKEKKITSYDLSTCRQADAENCVVFAIRDLVHISQHPDFLKFVQEQTGSSSEFSRLPPEMMKVTQLNKDKCLELEIIVTTKKMPSGTETLGDAVKRHLTPNEQGRFINTLAAKRNEKYQNIVIYKLIGIKTRLAP